MRKSRLQKSVPVTQWHESERVRLSAAIAQKGRRQVRGPANGWATATSRTVLSAYCCGLGWQRDSAILDWSLPPAQRWPEAVLEEYVAHLQATYASKTVHSRISGLERALAVLDPTGDRSLVVAALKRLGRPGPSLDKQRQVQPSSELLQLGIDIMESALAGGQRSPRLVAALFRTGLQIALLALRFWRISEFMALRVGVHVFYKDATWAMNATKANTPTKRRMRSGCVPGVLVPYLKRYLEVYRPLLCDGRYLGDALWVSTRAQPQSENGFRDNVRKFTGLRFNEPLSPHAFRHSAATTMAIHNPAQIDAVSRQMGHSGPRTRDKHYNLACAYSASIEWEKTWTEILREGREHRRLKRRH